MTRAPSNLLTVRKLLLTHLNIDESRVRSQDLEPAEVGIVGDSAHRGGYHCGSDRVVSGDYSVVESPRDRAGLTLDAAALDVGQFEVTVGGRTYDLPHFSAWCVGQCKANAPDSRDIREIIWSPDGRTVKRWDRLGKRSTGDSSHRWHTHFSFHRDAIKAGRDLTPLFRRYLTTIGLLEDDDMAGIESTVHGQALMGRIEALVRGYDTVQYGPTKDKEPVWVVRALKAIADAVASTDEQVAARLDAEFDEIDRAVAEGRTELAGQDEAVVAGVLAGLTPEKIAAAIPPALTQQVADQLAARLTGSNEQQG